ncbi:P1 family peptidase [Acidobacteriota bacterium]
MDNQRNEALIDKIPWRFKRGARNGIIDIENVKVGHLTISKDVLDESGEKVKVRTGLTAVFPDDMREEKRYFMDFYQARGGNEISGYPVVEDFRYLNSPLVLSNIHNFGPVYNAILSYGFKLGRSEIWPPTVLAVDDSNLDGSNRSTVDESEILHLLENASSLSVKEGSVGIGTGLRAFGWKGGIGSSSRMFTIGKQQFTAGALVASNLSNEWDSNERAGKVYLESKASSAGGSLSLIVGTDIPLLPYQIKRITTDIVMSLPLAKLTIKNNDSIMCVLFSVANAMTVKDDGPKVFEYTLSSDSILEKTGHAGSEAVKEAILRSVCLSKSLEGKSGRTWSTMPDTQFHSLLETFEETV